MSKVTVITDATGQIHAVGEGHLSEKSNGKSNTGQFQSGLRALPGQKLHEIDVPHDLTQMKNWKELIAKVQPHLPTRG
jgi:hypothetical protein